MQRRKAAWRAAKFGVKDDKGAIDTKLLRKRVEDAVIYAAWALASCCWNNPRNKRELKRCDGVRRLLRLAGDEPDADGSASSYAKGTYRWGSRTFGKPRTATSLNMPERDLLDVLLKQGESAFDQVPSHKACHALAEVSVWTSAQRLKRSEI